MIRKILFLFLVSTSFLNAYFMTEHATSKHTKMLQDFDVDVDFLSTFKVKNEIANKYKTKYFLKTLQQGNDLVPFLRSMIDKNDIPEIFLYLAMAESNFSLNATSKQKAVGLWQFIEQTAKKFGLRVDEYVDERKDPVKSTKAAIKYLKYLHNSFGKWYLAAMAYNCGEGRVRKAIKQAKSDELKILLDDEKKYIPLETRNYINKIISIASATNSIDFMIKNEADFLLNQGQNQIFDIVYVPSGTSLASIAEAINVSVELIKKYNAQLKYYFTPPDGKKYHIYIPYGKKNVFLSNFKPSKNYSGFYVHVVKSGENLSKIGAKYHIKYSLIKKFNNLSSNKLKLKQKLIIPIITKSSTYIVKKGDTIEDISKRFKIKSSALMKHNNITKYIKPGDKLVIP